MAINIPFFAPSSNDQSIYYLGQIFGTMGTILQPTSASLIFGSMFNTFNTIILTVGVLIVVYVTIIGVIKTAHEGEALGKNWSTLWLPIRMVMGIAALIPSTSGYSFLQIMIMWVIVQGIGIADSVWATTLKYSDSFGSVTAKVSTTAGISASSDMQILFQAMVCQASANFKSSAYGAPYKLADGTGGYCADTRADCQGKSSTSGKTSTIEFGPGSPGACGTMKVCNKTSVCTDTSASGQISCAACTAQQEALEKIMGNDTVNTTVGGQPFSFVGFGKLAQAFVETDFAYRVFYDSPLDPNANKPDVVEAYCNAAGVSGNACCGTPPVLIGQDGVPPSQQSCALKDAGLFSNSTIMISPPNDPPKSTVTLVYWPYLKQQNSDLSATFITDAANYYTAMIETQVNEKMNELTSGTNKISDSAIQSALNTGWLYAGAFYYSLADNNNKNQGSATPTLSLTGNDPAPTGSIAVNPLYSYRNNYTAAGDLISTANSEAASSGGTSGAGTTISTSSTSFPSSVSGLSKITDGFNSLANFAMDQFKKTFTGSESGVTNPLVSVQTYGMALLIAIQVVFVLILGTMVILGLMGYAGGAALGTTIDNPVGPTLALLSIIFTPLMSILLGGLFAFAALLAIYTPLIPFVIFTTGAVAWFILVIEAVIAGPLVALGLLLPGGQSELFGRAEPALMLLFSIFLRPALMIFGLVAAMLLSIVGVSMVNVSFNTVAGAAMSNPGPVELLLFIAAYASLILVVLNKSFTLIHMVPDQVLRWMGHHGGQEGAAQEALGEVKGGVQTGAKSMGEADQGMTQKADTEAPRARSNYAAAEESRKKRHGIEVKKKE